MDSERFKDLARNGSELYEDLYMVDDYAMSSDPSKKEFNITPMIAKVVNNSFFIIQYKNNFEFDRFLDMKTIDDELNMDCFFGKMNNLFSAYEDILGEAGVDSAMPHEEGNRYDTSSCIEGLNDWYAISGTQYFRTLWEAESFIAQKVLNYVKAGKPETLKLVPFDVKDTHPELLI